MPAHAGLFSAPEIILPNPGIKCQVDEYFEPEWVFLYILRRSTRKVIINDADDGYQNKLCLITRTCDNVFLDPVLVAQEIGQNRYNKGLTLVRFDSVVDHQDDIDWRSAYADENEG